MNPDTKGNFVEEVCLLLFFFFFSSGQTSQRWISDASIRIHPSSYLKTSPTLTPFRSWSPLICPWKLSFLFRIIFSKRTYHSYPSRRTDSLRLSASRCKSTLVRLHSSFVLLVQYLCLTPFLEILVEDSKRLTTKKDLRILSPWKELEDYARFHVDIKSMSPFLQNHIPWIVLAIKAALHWKETVRPLLFGSNESRVFTQTCKAWRKESIKRVRKKRSLRMGRGRQSAGAWKLRGAQKKSQICVYALFHPLPSWSYLSHLAVIRRCIIVSRSLGVVCSIAWIFTTKALSVSVLPVSPFQPPWCFGRHRKLPPSATTVCSSLSSFFSFQNKQPI